MSTARPEYPLISRGRQAAGAVPNPRPRHFLRTTKYPNRTKRHFFRVVRVFRGSLFLIHKYRPTAVTTRSTVIAVMHRKSIGQVRRKQGEHGTSDLSN